MDVSHTGSIHGAARSAVKSKRVEAFQLIVGFRVISCEECQERGSESPSDGLEPDNIWGFIVANSWTNF